MRRPNADHARHSWRVHALAPDFELLDVWLYPIRIDPEVPFAAFLEFQAETQREMTRGSGFAAQLFRLRGWLGRVFGWDDAPSVLERANDADAAGEEADPESVRARLEPQERGAFADLVSATAASEEGVGIGFDPVYRDDSEALLEIRNATVHALMHLGRVPSDGSGTTGSRAFEGPWSPQMAVLVKPRGLLGRFYMALIGPFRHLVVYPAMMRAAAMRWPAYAAAHGYSHSD